TPLPWFYTAGPDKRTGRTNMYAVIVTYLAEPLGAPRVVDLYGLMAIPRGKLLSVLKKRNVSLDELGREMGSRLYLDDGIPEGALVEPILSARSIMLLPVDQLKKRGL
ncbi:MAG: hypothetical protein JXA42_19410, partial [Anaerolineales bacterium]|nr:hypothetical protein [Anaerolineales bacterium]